MPWQSQGTMIECASDAGVIKFIAPHVVADVMDDIVHDIDYDIGTLFRS